MPDRTWRLGLGIPFGGKAAILSTRSDAVVVCVCVPASISAVGDDAGGGVDSWGILFRMRAINALAGSTTSIVTALMTRAGDTGAGPAQLRIVSLPPAATATATQHTTALCTAYVFTGAGARPAAAWRCYPHERGLSGWPLRTCSPEPIRERPAWPGQAVKAPIIRVWGTGAWGATDPHWRRGAA
ncbi:hypothetical protein K505DRAFT_359558 [Melanomma pulvis-pyrius CBS 109.77]|uniref:Uncharacterized protein n=1 Tax=Melanomma pulvis-pyrius CBS 109.77 TaxID=1314802 RepID=A0A6A6XKS3_9PLEO|nr:hypothetical protein K505DRAFT_359558 [Melanomma pulvis-pyrius CBS 109.77]